jgi:hypothetical protein
MRLTGILFGAALASALTCSPAAGQSRGSGSDACRGESGQVERRDDRFTGEATVTLKAQPVATDSPGQKLKMALEYTIKPEPRAESFIPETVTVTFTSASSGRIYEGEMHLVFLIDGERVRPVPAAVHDDLSRLSTEKVMTQTVFSGMTLDTLRRMTRAKTVEMKLAETEVKLSPELLAAIRSFAACALARK